MCSNRPTPSSTLDYLIIVHHLINVQNRKLCFILLVKKDSLTCKSKYLKSINLNAQHVNEMTPFDLAIHMQICRVIRYSIAVVSALHEQSLCCQNGWGLAFLFPNAPTYSSKQTEFTLDFFILVVLLFLKEKPNSVFTFFVRPKYTLEAW